MAMKRRVGGELTELEKEALRPAGGLPSGNLSDVPVDSGDQSVDEYAEDVSIGLLENEGEILREVDGALKRIDRGTFGRCENCRQEISKLRLKAVPYARYCVRCTRQRQSSAAL
jgi:RNA polymerase-binding transcription factor DksA